MATKFVVTYDGGDAHTYTVKPKHILKVEREGGSLEANIESSYRLAWLSSGSADAFEEWLETVEDIAPEGVEVAEDDANPT